jgi:riboflavin transporter FmnP
LIGALAAGLLATIIILAISAILLLPITLIIGGPIGAIIGAIIGGIAGAFILVWIYMAIRALLDILKPGCEGPYCRPGP